MHGKAQLSIQVDGGRVVLVDVEDDQQAALQELGGDGAADQSAVAAAALGRVDVDVADGGHAPGRRHQVCAGNGQQG